MKTIRSRVAAIVWSNGRRTAGDRRVLIVAGLLPVLVMVLVGALFNSGRAKVAIGVASEGSGAAGARLVAALKKSPVLRVRGEHSLGGGVTDLRRGVVLLAVEIPPGYDGTLAAGGQPQVTVKGQPGQVASTEALIAVNQLVDAESNTVVAARAQAAATHQSLDVVLASAPLASATARQVATVASTKGGIALNSPSVSPYSYTTPSNLVLFVFIVAFVTNVRSVSDRSNGLTRRILATPTPPVALILAELATSFVVAFGQCILLLGMGTLVFGVSWGNPLAIAAIAIALCLVGAGAGVTLGTIVSSSDQAIAVGVPLALVMGMLGGCMWPLEIVGPLMREVGHIAPTAWAMDAFVAVIYTHAGLAKIGRDLAVLAGFAIALLVVATTRLRAAVIG